MLKVNIILLRFLIFLLLIGGLKILPAQDCRSLTKYRQAMAKADSLIASGDYSAAYDQYNAAKVYCRDRSSDVQKAQDTLFVKINGLRDLAETAQNQAEERRILSEREKEEFRAQLEIKEFEISRLNKELELANKRKNED